MKRLCMYILFTISTTNVYTQPTGDRIKSYSTFLAKRNAQMIGADSLCDRLKPAYQKLITACYSYKFKTNGIVSSKQMAKVTGDCKKQIWKLLKGKTRRLYRHLWKRTGNILLIKPLSRPALQEFLPA